MHIKRVVVKNFRALRDVAVELNATMNILVGNNDAGKSTLLEAIELVIAGRLHDQSIASQLTSHLFNQDCVAEFLAVCSSETEGQVAFPRILIEAYLQEEPEEASLAVLRGTNNSLREDCPGILLTIERDRRYIEEANAYIASRNDHSSLPMAYYSVQRYSFAGNEIEQQYVPLRCRTIDTSGRNVVYRAGRYVSRLLSDALDDVDRRALDLEFRRLQDEFAEANEVRRVNEKLGEIQGAITSRRLSVSVDRSHRTTWDSALVPHLDDIPIELAGRGEQSAVRMKLAIADTSTVEVVLIEEPENHLSYSNMANLVSFVADRSGGKQVVIATHSSFVLNKLGVGSLILLGNGAMTRLTSLSASTRDFFMKMPGHDTLRLVLSKRAILVEGASDELIVQRAYRDRYGSTPLDDGVDVISVRGRSFLRFLELGELLSRPMAAIMDNDGDPDGLKRRYERFRAIPNILISFDDDATCQTLEPQLVRANSREVLNRVLNKDFANDDLLIEYMSRNKTDCALRIFSSEERLVYPPYINDAL